MGQFSYFLLSEYYSLEEQKAMKKKQVRSIMCYIQLLLFDFNYCLLVIQLKHMIRSWQTLQTQPCFRIRTQSSLRKKKGLYQNLLPKLVKRISWEAKLSNHSKLYRDERHNQNYFQAGIQKPSKYFACIGQLDCQDHLNNPKYFYRVNPLNQVQNEKTIPYLAVESGWSDPDYKGEKLQAGDIFRLATVNFAVVDIVDTQSLIKSSSFPQEVGKIYKVNKIRQKQNKISSESLPLKHKKIKKQAKEYQKPQKTEEEQPLACRVCRSQEETEADPLISPCKCKGSCGVIHLQCLKKWVASKNRVRSKQEIQWHSIFITSCEICKQTFPRAFDFGDKIVDLVSIQTRMPHYIVIQQFSNHPESEEKIVYILLPALPGFTHSFGTSHKNHICVSDPDVSKYHAEIAFARDHFCLRDCKSQLGSVIKLKRDFEFSSDRSLKIRVGTCFYEVMPMLSNQPLNTGRDNHERENIENLEDERDESEDSEYYESEFSEDYEDSP